MNLLINKFVYHSLQARPFATAYNLREPSISLLAGTFSIKLSNP